MTRAATDQRELYDQLGAAEAQAKALTEIFKKRDEYREDREKRIETRLRSLSPLLGDRTQGSSVVRSPTSSSSMKPSSSTPRGNDRLSPSADMSKRPTSFEDMLNTSPRGESQVFHSSTVRLSPDKSGSGRMGTSTMHSVQTERMQPSQTERMQPMQTQKQTIVMEPVAGEGMNHMRSMDSQENYLDSVNHQPTIASIASLSPRAGGGQSPRFAESRSQYHRFGTALTTIPPTPNEEM